MPKNTIQAGKNVMDSTTFLYQTIADNLNVAIPKRDGILEDYRGKIRGQELALQSKIDKTYLSAYEDIVLLKNIQKNTPYDFLFLRDSVKGLRGVKETKQKDFIFDSFKVNEKFMIRW